jgi:hypothetical protein
LNIDLSLRNFKWNLTVHIVKNRKDMFLLSCLNGCEMILNERGNGSLVGGKIPWEELLDNCQGF